MTTETEQSLLDTIIRFESALTEMEIHLLHRNAPFDDAEKRLFDRLDRILKRAKEIYLTT